MRDRICLVFGATSGIGRAVAEEFAAAGATVVAAGRREQAGESLVASLRDRGHTALFVRTDVTEEFAVAHAIERTLECFGRLDCAINCAGIAGANGRPTAEHTMEDWNRVMATNLTGLWLCLKYELRAMAAQAGGAIVNVASIFGERGTAFGIAPYVASKHAVIGLTRAAAVEYARHKIRVNALCPGITRSEMTAPAMEAIPAEFDANIKTHVPMERVAEPAEIARAALWLCQDGSGFVTGHALAADGGWLAK